MKIFVLGATGRVGTEFLRLALAAGHEVAVLVRDPRRLAVSDSRLAVHTGELGTPGSLAAAYGSGSWDAVVNVVGADPLKPSTLVTESARALIALAEAAGTPRYLAITGTAEMPKTVTGALSTFILRRTPVGHGVRDHNGAFAAVRASSLDWTLVACPWIKDGPGTGLYGRHAVFPGGMKTIHPADVAHALFSELEHPQVHRGIVGIWY